MMICKYLVYRERKSFFNCLNTCNHLLSSFKHINQKYKFACLSKKKTSFKVLIKLPCFTVDHLYVICKCL